MRHYHRIIIFTLLALVVFSLAGLTMAQEKNLQDAFRNSPDDPLGTAAGQAGYALEKTNALKIVSTVLNMMLSFIGVIFLISMIYGGFLWMTARGNDEQVNKAKNIMTTAVIGIVIIVLAYAISWFVLNRLGQNVLKSGSSQGPTGEIYGDDYYNTPGNN